MAYAPLVPLQGLLNPYGAQQLEFCHEIVYISPHQISYHIQPYYELIFFVHGDRKTYVGQHAYDCTEGSLICFNPREPHYGYNETTRLYERFVIHIYPNALVPFSDSDLMLRCFTQRPDCVGNLLSIPEEPKKRILQLLYEADACLKEQPQLAYHLILSVLLMVGKHCQLEETTSSPDIPHLIQPILKYVESNLSCTLDQLYKHFGISSSTLWRLFHEYMNISPKKYLILRKLSQGSRMILEGKPVAEVSEACGFSSPSYFISLFKSAYHKTPYQYQKTSRQKSDSQSK